MISIMKSFEKNARTSARTNSQIVKKHNCSLTFEFARAPRPKLCSQRIRTEYLSSAQSNQYR